MQKERRQGLKSKHCILIFCSLSSKPQRTMASTSKIIPQFFSIKNAELNPSTLLQNLSFFNSLLDLNLRRCLKFRDSSIYIYFSPEYSLSKMYIVMSRLKYRKINLNSKLSHYESVQILEWVSQRGCEFSTPGSIQNPMILGDVLQLTLL